MKISGFTIARNIVKYNYPAREAILSILPICDEFIINIGDSDDGTLELLKSISSPKIKIVERKWDTSLGEEVLTVETNFALSQCEGDWAFYVQTDEVVHERDLVRFKKYMLKYLNNKKIEGFRFKWLHFYGSFYRYRIDAGWFQKQDRIVRNNGMIEANKGAWGFRRKDGGQINTIKTPCYIYHYGWVNNPKIMAIRRKNAQSLGYANLTDNEEEEEHDFGNLNRFPIYFGTHPKVMQSVISSHKLSIDDWNKIKRRYFWNPLLWFRLRYKTPKRCKYAIN